MAWSVSAEGKKGTREERHKGRQERTNKKKGRKEERKQEDKKRKIYLTYNKK
jgi:hypothetical protein